MCWPFLYFTSKAEPQTAGIGKPNYYPQTGLRQAPNSVPKCSQNSTHFRRPSFVIALHSPNGFVETGLRMCSSEKKASKLVYGFCGTLSLVRFDGETSGIAAICRDFRMNAARFLCVADCVAEGEGFEPPVRFPVQRFSRPPVSTTHTSLREGVQQVHAASG